LERSRIRLTISAARLTSPVRTRLGKATDANNPCGKALTDSLRIPN
jgi:hypothetical protein